MRLRIINQELLIFYEKMGKIAVLSSFFIFISIMPFAAYAKVNQLTIPTGVGSSDDSSCLVIKRVELMNIDAFPNAGRLIQWTKQAQGNCLDEKGLSSLRDTLQWQLVADGYITSHAVFTEDSYVDGTLFLTLIPGRLASIEHHEDSQSYAQLNTVFPGRQGDLVNLRNLEQGLDNLQRLPSVNATMDVVLNPEDLSSQIMVTRQQSRF